MSFQDQKFPILLGAVTALAVGGLLFWSIRSGSKYEAAKAQYDEAAHRIGRMMRGPVEPTDDNLLAKKQAVESYADSVEELQQAFDPLRRPKIENIEPSAYTNELLAARERVNAAFEKAGATVPEAFFLGHGRFSDTPPMGKDTGVLSFELAAFERLLTKLAEARPASLDNVFWPGIPEIPKDAAYVAHPIEISFTGHESSLRDFLSALDDIEGYYYATRVIRVKNQRDTAPNSGDARFEAAPTPDSSGGTASDPFGAGGFVFPEETEGGDATPEDGEEPEEAPAPDPEPETDSSEILKQVLGGEDVQVFLRIDVLQFLEPRKLP